MASLARELAELDRRCTSPTDADRWGAIREWLERHEVVVDWKVAYEKIWSRKAMALMM